MEAPQRVQQAAPPVAAQQQSAPQANARSNARANGGNDSWRARRTGTDNGGQRREARQGWRSGNQAAANPPVVEQAQVQQRRRDQAGDNRQGSGRNRTYSDPNRNQTYRNNDRDARRIDNRDDRRDERRAYNNGRRDSNRWNNDWRRDNRYNWSSYRDSHRNIYRSSHYYAPYRNYNYRRLSIGFSLDSLFFGSSYWISDPWQYRLPPAYGPYRWVRYYDDVLLIDTYTGEVVDVIHDFFW